MVKCRLIHRLSLDPQLRQRIHLIPDRLARMRAIRQLARVRVRLVGVRRRNLGKMRGNSRRSQHLRLEVLPRPGRDLAFQARVVAQNPAIALLGVAQWVAREPLDAQLRVRAGGEVGEVAQNEDGGVRGANDGDAGGCVGG